MIHWKFHFLYLIAFLITASAVAEPSQPYSYDSVKAWQQSLKPWPWHFPPEQEVSLNRDSKQMLEAIRGGTRSGEFILFAKIDNEWLPISGTIHQSHHPIRILDHTIGEWHDFQTFVPLWGSGGNEVLILSYRWNGSKYTELDRQQGKFCDYEPFKSSSESCIR